MIVLDASVFVKTFAIEPDSGTAIDAIKALQRLKKDVKVPEIFVYEVAHVARRAQFDVVEVINAIEHQVSVCWNICSPTRSQWKLAQSISLEGHPKSGYPAMYDSIYHAIALEEGGVFLTADKKHYAKAKHLGAISLLKDWEAALEQAA